MINARPEEIQGKGELAFYFTTTSASFFPGEWFLTMLLVKLGWSCRAEHFSDCQRAARGKKYQIGGDLLGM